MLFHLAHIVPTPRHHGLYGYAEVIESFRWGLSQLGHDVTVGLNHIFPDRINILFGFHLLAPAELAQCPDNTIIYNLEQMVGLTTADLKPNCLPAAQRLQIWDFCTANLELWHQLHPRRTPICVPIGWAPTLERIPNAPEDIDVLFYGIPSPERLHIISQLCHAGMRCLFACGLYGDARDSLIARSKIILNINQYHESRIFEIVRVSYLLANAKAVVSDFHPNSIIEADLNDALVFAPLDNICQVCAHLLAHDSERQQRAARGQTLMRRRDMRQYLRPTLAQLP